VKLTAIDFLEMAANVSRCPLDPNAKPRLRPAFMLHQLLRKWSGPVAAHNIRVLSDGPTPRLPRHEGEVRGVSSHRVESGTCMETGGQGVDEQPMMRTSK
jgi:hypothetical protein